MFPNLPDLPDLPDLNASLRALNYNNERLLADLTEAQHRKSVNFAIEVCC